jgi:hypothetical protein
MLSESIKIYDTNFAAEILQVKILQKYIVLQRTLQYCSTCTTSIIIMQYSMYHKRPLDAQNTQPIPMPEGGRSERPEAGRSGIHFGGRCCLTAGATMDHSPDASRLRHPDRKITTSRVTGTGIVVQLYWCTAVLE